MSSDNKSMSKGKTKYMISCAYGFGFNVGYSLLYIPKIMTSFYIYIYIYGIHIGILSRSVGGYHSKHAKWESLFHIGGYTQQCLFPYGKFMKWSRSCHYLQMGILYAL